MTPTPEPTPAVLTTEAIRAGYAFDSDLGIDPYMATEFDAWLAAHDAQVAEKAWDEGERAGERNVIAGAARPAETNPYRKAAHDA